MKTFVKVQKIVNPSLIISIPKIKGPRIVRFEPERPINDTTDTRVVYATK